MKMNKINSDFLIKGFALDETTIPIYDLVIIGGGFAGLTLASMLGAAGLNILLAEATDTSSPMKGDERTTAISYGSSKVMMKAGVWDDLLAMGCPIDDIRILDGESPLLLNFLKGDIQGKSFGWIIENIKIRDIFKKRLQAFSNIHVRAPLKFLSYQARPHENLARIDFSDGTSVLTRLLVGADGRQSAVREAMDIQCRRKDYKQTAFVGIVRHEHPHDNAAVEHFWPEGPFAILPMIDDAQGHHRSSVVFTIHGRGDLERSMQDSKILEIKIREKFPPSYGKIDLVGALGSYPLMLNHAENYTASRAALIGDAAHGIHPIAGQGLNLGFRDVDELAQLIINAHAKGDDIGADQVLQTYQRRRRPDNMAMVAFTDTLVKLFSNNNVVLRRLRRIGLKMVARMPRTKEFFMKQAMADKGS
jgi:2-octaprenyl-6-methoxyphenol hydroxylase